MNADTSMSDQGPLAEVGAAGSTDRLFSAGVGEFMVLAVFDTSVSDYRAVAVFMRLNDGQQAASREHNL
jgi:hypothetical protein